MFWRVLSITIFTFNSMVFAGPLETLSQGAFFATGNRCASYDAEQTEKQISDLSGLLCAENNSVLSGSLSGSGAKSIAEFEKLSRFAEAGAEEKFFTLLANQQSTELTCAADFADHIASGALNENIQAKLELAKIAKQNLAKAAKTLATNPKVAGRVCPLDAESIKTQFREGDPAKELCESILQNRTSFNAIISTIPLAEVPSVRTAIDKFIGATNDQKFDVKKIYSQAAVDLKYNSANIQKLLSSEGPSELTRADRRALMADPALIEKVINSAPADSQNNLRGLSCRADSRYGKGSENLEIGTTIFALGLSAGVGVLARSSMVAAEVTAARTAGMISLNSMRLLNIAVVGVDTMTLLPAVKNACVENNVVTVKTRNACTSAPTLETVAQDDCILMATLAATGYAALVPPATLAALNREIKLKGAFPLISKIEKRSNAENKQDALWALRADGKELQAAGLEHEIAANFRTGKIVDIKKIGHGASSPYYVRFEDGTEGIWKRNKGWPSDGRKEIATYKIDKALELDLVPVTVERKLLGEEGTVQLRVTKLKKTGEVDFPHELEFFDDLIGNGDRHGGNYLQRQDGSAVAIDHGLAFTEKKTPIYMLHLSVATRNLERAEAQNKKLEAIIRTMKDAKGDPAKLKKVEEELAKSRRTAAAEYQKVVAAVPDKKVIAKLKTMTLEKWKQLLSEELSPKEIELLYNNQVKILKEISIAEGKLGPRIYRDGPVSPTFFGEEASDFYHPLVPPKK